MTTYNNQLVVLEAGRLQKISSADNIGISGSVTIGGNLTVTGSITSGSTINALSQDQFIDLAIGQNSTTAKPGGFTVTSQRSSGTATYPTVSFTAGVGPAVSAPVIVVAGNAQTDIPADAIVEISGATASINNGIYLVQSSVYDGTTNTTLTLYGTGGTAVPGDMLFCQSQVATATDSGATAFKPYLVVMCAADGITVKTSAPAIIAQGQFAYASGSTKASFFENWVQVTSGAAAVTLQDAYNNGNTIDMTATDGAFTVAPDTGETVGFSISGSAASLVTVAGNNLTLSTTGSGTLAMDSAGTLTIDADSTLSINATAAINIGDGANAFAINVGIGAAQRLITIGNGTGNTEVQIDTGTNGFDVNALGVASISSVGNSEFTVGSGNLSLATTTSGSVLIDGIGGVELNSASGAIAIGNDTNTGAIDIGTGASARTITIGNATTTTAVNINTGSGGLDVSAGGASTFNVTSGALDIDSAGALSLNSTGGVINIGNDADAQNINIGTGAAARVISIGNLTGASGLALKAGTGDIDLATASAGTITATAIAADVTLTTTTSGDVTLSPANDVNLTPAAGFNVRVDQDALFAAAGGIEINLVSGAVKGNVVYINASGDAVLAQNDVLADALVDGVALEANAGATAVKRVGTVYGTKVFVKFTSAPSVGDIAYLSATAGEATATLPTSGRIFQIGRVIGGVSSGLYPVLFHPQYIADN